ATGTFANGTQQLAAVIWNSSPATTAQISNDATNFGSALPLASPSTATPVPIAATTGTISTSVNLTIRPTGFIPTGSMSSPHALFQATLLNNGTVLATGGTLELVGAQIPAEIYDPSTGAFTTTATPLSNHASFYAQTLLRDGRVLITGGAPTSGSALVP